MTRLHYLQAIKEAKDAGMDGFAFAICALYYKAFPEDEPESSRRAQDQQVLKDFQLRRKLKELS